MTKLVLFIAFVCLGFISARGPPNERYHEGDSHRPHNDENNHGISKLCANNSLAQSFLTQMRALITQLSSNDSFAQVLQQRAHEIAYIQNNTDAQLLSSNCTQYFEGLDAAQDADLQAQRQQEQYERTVTYLFQEIIAALLGYNIESSEGS
ncbi:unnamed protein product [Rotaria sp. Silwood2]|nr:unnamed protein product [Rotaria sp. Silwood2]CAF4276250.1 unnamed protein product [Rotaria sp. Silwood2]